MDAQATGDFARFFNDLPDPRGSNLIHKLHDILVIALCAVICGADGWAQVELFGKSKLKWFKTFLDLPGGVPSHDTFGRLFARLDPEALERCFMAWTAALAAGEASAAGTTRGRLVAIDGKSIRRSFEHAWDKSGMTHLVSAFVAENEMVFGQLAIEARSNEIEAIPRLLALLDLTGATVTIDAIGCQRQIARQITDGGGHYVLAVKENQKMLHSKVRLLLDEAILGSFKGMSHDLFEQTEGDHGRIETRRVWVTDEVHHLRGIGDWPKLASVAVVESQRQNLSDPSGKVSIERRYYISSLEDLDAERMAGAIRGHWGIENKLHWQLDVSFGEDQRRIRKGHGAENHSRLCRLALNLLKRDKSTKAGIHGKRLKAGWDHEYLLTLLAT